MAAFLPNPNDPYLTPPHTKEKPPNQCSSPRAEDKPKSPQREVKSDFVRPPSVKVHLQSPQEQTQDLLVSQGRGYITLQKPSGVTKNCVNYEGTDTRKDPVGHVMIKDFDQMVFKRLGVARRSLREIAMMAHFRNHPNVVGLLDFVCLPQQCTLVAITERLDYDLRDVFKSTYIFGEQQITCLMYQLLFALLYIHRAEVVHGDIKPVNIQLSTSCDLKLGGFDSAHGDSYCEEPSEYVTTRLWKAPEQVMCEKHVSFKVDIWAVGCILAQIYNRSTAGLSPEYKPLFSGTTHSDQLEQIVNFVGTPNTNDLTSIDNDDAKEYIQRNLSGRPRKDLSMVLHSPDGTVIPKKVVELLDEMLQFDPKKRPSVDEVMQNAFFSEHYHPEDLKIPRDKFRELDDLEEAARLKAKAACAEPHRPNATREQPSTTTEEESPRDELDTRQYSEEGVSAGLKEKPDTAASQKVPPVRLDEVQIGLFVSAFTDELRRGLDFVPPESSAAEASSSSSSSDTCDSPTAESAGSSPESPLVEAAPRHFEGPEREPKAEPAPLHAYPVSHDPAGEGLSLFSPPGSTNGETESRRSLESDGDVLAAAQMAPLRRTFVGKNAIFELITVFVDKIDVDRQEFRRLLRLLKVLQQTSGHPGFVPLVDVRFQDNSKNNTFEVITFHEPTAKRLSETGHDFQLSRAHFRALLESLAFVERAGLCLGKIDPTSVFVDDKGHVQLDVCSAFFGPSATLGAVYEAPEQIWGGEPCHKSDIWALGCLMAEVFTGQPLFPVVMEAGCMAKVSPAEQLAVILHTLGCPSREDQREISDDSVQGVIRDTQRQACSDPESFWAALEDRGVVPGPAVDLLQWMLGFSSRKRATAQEALAHPFFEGVDSCELPEAMPLPGLDALPSKNSDISKDLPLQVSLLHSLLCGQKRYQQLLREANQLIHDSVANVLMDKILNRSKHGGCGRTLTVSPAVNRCLVGKAFLVHSGPGPCHASEAVHKAQLVPSELPKCDILDWVEKLVAVRGHTQFVALKDVVHDLETQRVVLLLEPRMMDLEVAFSQQQLASKFPLQEKIAVAYQLLFALYFLHKAGYCHGHLTPLSVTLNGPKDIIQIEDFGAPVSAADALPNWSAPEVLRGEPPTPAADMWSCGTIIAQMLNQSSPQPDQDGLSDGNVVYPPLFPGPNTKDVLQQIRERPDPVAELGCGPFPGDRELLPLLRSMLCTEPAERISAEAAMKSPLFERLQSAEDLTVVSQVVDGLEPCKKLFQDAVKGRVTFENALNAQTAF